MFNHAPDNYDNPFITIVNGGDFGQILTNKEDIFYQDETITAFVAALRSPNNSGNAIVIPNIVYENLYDIPDDVLAKIHVFSKKLAIAMKEIYRCDGVSTLQHNEPAGNQHVWHYHLHVIPRYKDDKLYQLYGESLTADPLERADYANKLRNYFKENQI